jgi:hypothetical protein
MRFRTLPTENSRSIAKRSETIRAKALEVQIPFAAKNDLFEEWEQMCGGDSNLDTSSPEKPADSSEPQISKDTVAKLDVCMNMTVSDEQMKIRELPAPLKENSEYGKILAELGLIKGMIQSLPYRLQVQEFYSTEEFARHVDKAEFTVREWCRNGRLNANKRKDGRGPNKAWTIPHSELERYRKDGLLPLVKNL